MSDCPFRQASEFDFMDPVVQEARFDAYYIIHDEAPASDGHRGTAWLSTHGFAKAQGLVNRLGTAVQPGADRDTRPLTDMADLSLPTAVSPAGTAPVRLTSRTGRILMYINGLLVQPEGNSVKAQGAINGRTTERGAGKP